MTMKKKVRILFLVSLFLLTLGSVANAKTIYVDADAAGNNNGTNWVNAYNYLQDALADANTSPKPVEIRVAQGTYTPDSNSADPNGSGDRTATFGLINGVTLKGGYAGDGEPDPNARDITSYETILSGDLDGNDVPVGDPCDLLNHPNRAENSYHVVTGSGTDANAVLDGFTITAGNANGTVNPNRRGGGMYNYSTAALVNCTFTNNSARSGGGIRNYGRLTLTNCTFTDNFAFYRGGGTNNRLASLILNGCTFAGNRAERGGGVYIEYMDDSIFTNCTFTGNSAEGGGGIYAKGGSPMLIKCIFRSNCAKDYGGGISSDVSPCFPTLIDCVFTGNSAGDWGGAMYNGWEVEFTLTNCTFTDNSAGLGGGICCYGYCWSPVLTNCIFRGNLAVSAGGGLYSYHRCNATLTNCTFAGNSAAKGSAVGCDSYGQSYPSDLRLTNCILWDGGNEIWNNDGSTITVTFSDVQDAWPGLGNIEVDPCFVDADGTDDIVGTEDDDLHLLWASDCINTGDPCFVFDANERDIDGEPRVMVGRIDMGADEVGEKQADFTRNGRIDTEDLGVFVQSWLTTPIDIDWYILCDLIEDDQIDLKDYADFAADYLWQASWYEP